ncbi:hypothetical protein BX616_003637, partial [Lobosporangium transversale]
LEDQQTIEYFSYRSGYKSGREQQEPSVAPKSLRTASEDYDQSVLCTAWESGDEQCSSSKKSKLEHVSIEPIFNITPSSENDYYDEALQYESISPSPSSEKLSGAPDDACSTSTISLSTLGQTNSATSRSLLRTPTSSTTRPAIVTPLRPLSLNGPRTYSPLACITTSPGISFLRTPTSVGQASKAPNRYSEPSRDSSAASRHTRPSMLRFSYGDSHSTRSLVSPQPPPELNTTGIRSEEPKLTSSREGNREEEGANQAESAGDGKQKNTFLSTFSSAEILIQSEYKAEIVDYGDEEINDTNEGTTSENEKEEGVRPLAPAYDEHLGQKCAIQAVITGKSTEGACDIKQDESTVDDKGNKRPSSPPSSWWLVEQDEIDYNSDKENIDPRQYQRSDHSGSSTVEHGVVPQTRCGLHAPKSTSLLVTRKIILSNVGPLRSVANETSSSARTAIETKKDELQLKPNGHKISKHACRFVPAITAPFQILFILLCLLYLLRATLLLA